MRKTLAALALLALLCALAAPAAVAEPLGGSVLLVHETLTLEVDYEVEDPAPTVEECLGWALTQSQNGLEYTWNPEAGAFLRNEGYQPYQFTVSLSAAYTGPVQVWLSAAAPQGPAVSLRWNGGNTPGDTSPQHTLNPGGSVTISMDVSLEHPEEARTQTGATGSVPLEIKLHFNVSETPEA